MNTSQIDKRLETVEFGFDADPQAIKNLLIEQLDQYHKELLDKVCFEIANYAPLGVKETKELIKIIRKL